MIVRFLIFLNFFFGFDFQSIGTKKLYVGQSAKLICGNPDKYYNIPIKFKWEKPLGNVIGNEQEYVIKSANFNDGGIYTCRISQTVNNKIVEQTISTDLSVEKRDIDSESEITPPPVFADEPKIQFKDIHQERVELLETEFLYTSCKASNWESNDYTARWLFNQAPVNGANNILFISPLDADKHAGYYTCQITHKLYPHKKFEKAFLVDIKKPEILVTPLPEESLKIGGRIYRKCELQGRKFPNGEALKITWRKDNSFDIFSGPILDLPITDGSANGEYTCVVLSQKLNKQYTSQTNIRIDSIDSRSTNQQKISIFSQPISPELNKEFKLKCEIYPQIPNANYIWRKDNNVISSQQTLTISSFQRKDIGAYSCEITTPFGDSLTTRSTSDRIDVRFQYSPVNKIELDEAGSQMISRVGEKREMHCEISSSSESRGVNVEWFFNNEKLNNFNNERYSIYRNDRTYVSIITLVNITPMNEGLYSCKVDNINKKANLIVVKEESSLTINPERIIRNEGEPVEFHCRGNSIPEFSNTKIKWSFRSRDGRTVISNIASENRWEIVNSNDTPETSFISILRSLYKDDGFYTCTAPDGSQRTAELVIKRKEDSLRLTITPETVKVRDGQPIIVECFSESERTGEPYGEPRFTMESGRSLSLDPRLDQQNVGQSRVRLSIKEGLQTIDNNFKVECHAGIQVKTATIFLENQCPPNYRRCNNGECQPSGKFCDGFSNCADGSDENPTLCNKCDPLINKCEMYQNKSPIKSVFLVHWKCDGENDCGNNFDESQCTENDNMCNNVKFKCKDGKVIPRAYQCDKESDCTNSDDEIGCVLPQVTSTTSDKVKRIRRGSSVELKCESYGVPRPHVVWRFNWGCLRDNLRMPVTTQIENCNKVISILRIINFQPGDDGIYNCETLSGSNRSFSEDYQLILDNN